MFLLMSAYQLSAIWTRFQIMLVNEAVELAKLSVKKAVKLVSTLSFRISCVKAPDILLIKRKNKRDSIAYSLPVWLVAKLKEEYGEERAKAIFESAC